MKKYAGEMIFGSIFIVLASWSVYATVGKGWVDIYQAKKAVREQLVDPDSAEFRNMVSVSDGLVCGEVNSKNRMGGYAGYEKLIYERRDDGSINVMIPSPGAYYRYICRIGA